MTEQEKQIIKEWEENTDADLDELWDISHTLLLYIKPDYVEQAREVLDEEDIYEDENSFAIDACMPSFMDEVSEEAFFEWIAAYHKINVEWIDDYTISG